jgi:hypothetical protein
MVIKPLDFVARGKKGLIQPAIKCRGPEYLRIIYGPDYTMPQHLDRLRERGLGAKRGLALWEFALGVEGLDRFVKREPLRRVHECVFVVGRKSLGTRPKRLVQGWIERASAMDLLRASVGSAPSLADVIRMVHPRPVDAARAALYAYLIGKPYDVALLPAEIQAFEAFKRDPSGDPPDVPFLLLTALPLTAEQWGAIALRCSWQSLRMNLATLARHGVFALPGMVFTPGVVQAGVYEFAVGTAGSIGLVLQTVLLPLALANAPSRLTLRGGTHNPYAPPFEFLAESWLAQLRRIGFIVETKLLRHGFYPAGG